MRLRCIIALLGCALSSSAQTLHLIPVPRDLRPSSTQSLTAGIQINCSQPCDPEDAFAIADLQQTLAARRIPVSAAPSTPHILITRFGSTLGRSIYQESLPNSGQSSKPTTMPTDMAPEGYVILPDHDGIAITAQTSAGVFYALQTVKQLIVGDGAGAVLHIAAIRDWPAMQYRGLHDDLSRGPIGTLDFQKKLIRTLAAYKANLYSPYFEHTQQYASNPLAAPPGGSISAADARELVTYAAQYHVMIVPEQESFGHIHHTLIFDQYSALAETPHGSVLAPGQPGSLDLIRSEFAELAQLYPSPFLHVGADETQDLGLGQTKAAVEAGGPQGLAKVYLNFMQQIDTTLRPLHRRLLFWGDIAQDSPDLLKAMPAQFKRDTIAIGWQYNPEPKGFAMYLKPYADAGFETWVAPGVNNWSVIYPNYNYALANIQQFTRDGQRMGATGQLNTIWYDDGEALASNNYYGILFGAAAAWQQGESSIEQFEQSYGQVFHGDATGKLNQAQIELMAAHDLLKTQAKVGDGSDGLFWVDPWSKDGQNFAAKLRPYTKDLRLHAERAITLIAEARAAYPAVAASPIVYTKTNQLPSNPTSLRETDAIDALELGARRFDLIGLKFELADEIAQGYARAQADAVSRDKETRKMTVRELSDINGVNGRIRDLIDTYSLLRDLYSQSWLRTNRPYSLRPVLERYDYTIALWLSRSDKMRSAQRQWTNSQTLQSPTDVGIPSAPTN
jgi:hexosaminidase